MHNINQARRLQSCFKWYQNFNNSLLSNNLPLLDCSDQANTEWNLKDTSENFNNFLKKVHIDEKDIKTRFDGFS